MKSSYASQYKKHLLTAGVIDEAGGFLKFALPGSRDFAPDLATLDGQPARRWQKQDGLVYADADAHRSFAPIGRDCEDGSPG